MTGRLSWQLDAGDWPNRSASRFVRARGLTWHVQVMGSGPTALLIHGTGAATHSWRTLAPLLASRFTVVAPDLPGHGFTETTSDAGFTLPRVASGISALLKKLGLSPGLIAGHSAGAAVGARMCLDRLVQPDVLVSLNGALLPMPALPTDILGPLARLFAGSPLTARALALMVGGQAAVQRLIRSGGSTIDAEGIRLYARLAATPAHVGGALRLMANWDLRPLARDLPHLTTRLVLVTGSNDGMVPASEANRVRSLVPRAELVSLPGLGHLAHEEQPQQVAAILRDAIVQDAAA